jgi:hypothetical protein
LKNKGVIIRGRIAGELGVSRAFGNYEHKDVVISEPETT